MAELYAIRNDNDAACDWLKKATDNGHDNVNCVETFAIRKLSCFKTIEATQKKKEFCH
jgi:hypothetical protein